MKRYIALTFALLFVAATFASCSHKFNDGQVLNDLNGDEYPVATNADGDISRNENGDLILLVTDEDGKVVKDDKGETLTQASEIDHALVIGDTIEFQNYYIKIPNGWENFYSYDDLIIKKSSNEDQIKIMFSKDGKLDDKISNARTMINATEDNFENVVIEEKGIKIGDNDSAPFYASYIPVSKNGNPFYLGYAFLEREEGIYTFMITANRNLSEDFDEISEILNSVQYK